MTIKESNTKTSHLERKRLEYFRMKEDFVILLNLGMRAKKTLGNYPHSKLLILSRLQPKIYQTA
jgi:hypothetical protein